MADYVSKPYTVEAIQFTGTNLEEIAEFIRPDLITMKVEYKPNMITLSLETTSGVTQAETGYWIIQNEKELWYCMSDKDFRDTFVTAGTPKEHAPPKQEKARS